jgi:hypothetical protein
MASLHQFPDSRYWFACFIGPDGRQTQRSTKETGKGRAHYAKYRAKFNAK